MKFVRNVLPRLVLTVAFFSILFASSAFAAGFTTVDGQRYLKDEKGENITGWLDEELTPLGSAGDVWKQATYYLQPDGTLAVDKWVQIAVTDPEETNQNQTYWFYFSSAGKKVHNDGDKNCKERKIGDKYYAFADDGHMLTGWVDTVGGAETAADMRYYNADGSRQGKGWFRAIPSKQFNELAHNDEQPGWFYAGDNGKVFHNALKTINNKKYLFDDGGQMVSGLVFVSFTNGTETELAGVQSISNGDELEGIKGSGAGDEKTGLYYFGDEATDGAMKYGHQVLEIDGQPVDLWFKKSGKNAGKGVTGIEAGKYYIDGVIEKADKDAKYEIRTLDNGKEFLLSSTGAAITSGTKTDGDGNKWRVKNGHVEQVD